MKGRLVSRLAPTIPDPGSVGDTSPDPASGLGTYLRTVRRVTQFGDAARDTANMQAALTVMAGIGEVVALPGTGLYNASLTLPADTILTGSGTLQASQAGVRLLSGTKAHRTRINGVQLAGYTSGNALVGGEEMIYFAHSQDVEINGVRWSGGRLYCVSAWNCEELHVNGGRAQNVATGVWLVGCRRSGVRRGWTLRDSGMPITTFAIALHFGANDSNNQTDTTAASFTQPAVGSTVTVQMANTSWALAGQRVFIAGGGFYTVASIVDSTHLSLKNLGEEENANAGATVSSSAMVSPGPCVDSEFDDVNVYNCPAWQCVSIDSGICVSVRGKFRNVLEGISNDNTSTYDYCREILIHNSEVECTLTSGQASGSNYGIRISGASAGVPRPKKVKVNNCTVRYGGRINGGSTYQCGVFFEVCDGCSAVDVTSDYAGNMGFAIGTDVQGFSGAGIVCRNVQSMNTGVGLGVGITDITPRSASTGEIVGVNVDTAPYGVGASSSAPSPDFHVREYRGRNIATATISQQDGITFEGRRPYTAGATTPSVDGATTLPVANASATTITALTGGVEGQRVTVGPAADANTTIQSGTSLILRDQEPTLTLRKQDSITFDRIGTAWIEVARGDAWTPAQEAILSLRADSVTIGSGKVTAWTDLAGNFTCSQGTSGKQGTQAVGQNGRSYVQFDGANTFYSIGGSDRAANDWLVFMVLDGAAASTAYYAFTTTGSGTLYCAPGAGDSSSKVGFYDGTAWGDQGTSILGIQSLIWDLRSGASAANIYRNGAVLSTTAVTYHQSGLYPGSGTASLGAVNSAGSAVVPFSGKIYELAMFANPGGTKADALRARLSRYRQSFYAL